MLRERRALPGLLLWIWPAAVFALCAALGQTTFYPIEGTQWDGLQLIYNFLERGNLAHPHHPLYLPLARLFLDATAWSGLGIHRRLTLFSALGVAGAVFLAGLAARRAGLGEGRVLLVQALVALSPAVVFFGTVVELHGPFLFFAFLPFVAAEGVLEARGRRALVLGALAGGLTWLAALAHSTGNLLAPLVACWLLARGGGFAPAAALVATHLLLLFAGTPLLFALLGADPGTGTGRSLEWLSDKLHFDRPLFRLWTALRDEVLISHPPLWLALLLPLVRRYGRRALVFGALGLLPYAFLIVFGLPDPLSGEPIYEHGSYLLPLVLPAAWLLSGALARLERAGLRRALAFLLVAAGAARAVQQVRAHDLRPFRALGAGMRAATGDRRCLLITGQLDDLAARILEVPRALGFHLTDFLVNPSVRPEELAAALEAQVRRLARAGVPVYLTARAREVLVDPEQAARRIHLGPGLGLAPLLARLRAVGPPLLARLERGFRFEEVRAGPFRAWRLVPR